MYVSVWRSTVVILQMEMRADSRGLSLPLPLRSSSTRRTRLPQLFYLTLQVFTPREENCWDATHWCCDSPRDLTPLFATERCCNLTEQCEPSFPFFETSVRSHQAAGRQQEERETHRETYRHTQAMRQVDTKRDT